MHENMIMMLENAMHKHVRTNQQYLTQRFNKKLKNPKFFPKAWKPSSKCMKWMGNEKKEEIQTTY